MTSYHVAIIAASTFSLLAKISVVDQIVKNYRNKSASGLSWINYFSGTLSYATLAWLLSFTNSIPAIIIPSFGALLYITVLLQIWWYD